MSFMIWYQVEVAELFLEQARLVRSYGAAVRYKF